MLSNRSRIVFYVALGLSAAALLFLVVLGVFARPLNDDYYYMSADSSITPSKGFDLMVNGRIASMLTYGIFYPVPHFLQLVPLVGITITLIGLYMIVRPLIGRQIKDRHDGKVAALTISSGLTLAICLVTPSLYNSFYWFAADPVHTWSIGFVLIFSGLLLKKWLTNKERRYGPLLLLVIPAFIGTFYETAAVLLILVSLSYLLFVYFKKRKHLLVGAWCGLAGSFISLLALFFAPGALRRRELVAKDTDTGLIDKAFQLPEVIWHNLTHITPNIINNRSVFIIVFCAVALISLMYAKKKITIKQAAKLLFASTAVFSLGLILNIAVIWVGLGQRQPLRAAFYSAVMLILMSAAWGAITGMILRRFSGKKLGIALGGLISVPLLLIAQHAAYVPYLTSFGSNVISLSQKWDERDTYIKDVSKRPGVCDVGVKEFPVANVWHLSRNKNFWVNNAMSHYYGLRVDGRKCFLYTTDIDKPFK